MTCRGPAERAASGNPAGIPRTTARAVIREGRSRRWCSTRITSRLRGCARWSRRNHDRRPACIPRPGQQLRTAGGEASQAGGRMDGRPAEPKTGRGDSGRNGVACCARDGTMSTRCTTRPRKPAMTPCRQMSIAIPQPRRGPRTNSELWEWVEDQLMARRRYSAIMSAGVCEFGCDVRTITRYIRRVTEVWAGVNGGQK